MTSILTTAERAPLGAVYRVILGFVLFPLASILRLPSTNWRDVTVLILSLLVVLRVGPAAVRRVFRFPDGVKAVWAERRQLAKRYDSYQWRKLFWLGLGLCAYIGLSRDFQPSRAIPSLACLLAGAVGMAIWSRRKQSAEVQAILSGVLAGD